MLESPWIRKQHRDPVHRRPIEIKELFSVLQDPPPIIEEIDELEIYQIGANGEREKRICGGVRRELPTFVPGGLANPHNVENPRKQYRCTNPAGMSVKSVNGIGPCWKHAPMGIKRSEKVQEFMRQFLANHGYKEGTVSGTNELNSKIAELQANMTVEELLDGTRLLWEIEALRKLAIDAMESDQDNEYCAEDAEHIARLMDQLVDMRLKMVKTDSEIVKNQAVASIVRVVLNGVVMIVERQLGPGSAAKVLEEFKQTLLIPMNEHGFSEILRRHEAAGLLGAISVSANDFKVEDLKRDVDEDL